MNMHAPFRPFETHLDLAQTQAKLADKLAKYDGGELYIEKSDSESLVFDMGRLRSNSYNSVAGFGIRAYNGAETSYAHSERIEKDAIAQAISAISLESPKVMQLDQANSTQRHDLYQPDDNPTTLAYRLAKIQELEDGLRALDPRIINVTISVASANKEIALLQAEGAPMHDARPMAMVNVQITVDENGRRESGHAGRGGRVSLASIFDDASVLDLGKEALRVALVNLTAEPAPAGELDLLVGPGWPGVLFHEAVGHGLEGDFNRKKSSAFSSLMGKKIAADGVRVIDDGTIAQRRGSLHFDDEGSTTNRTTLIEDGVLVSYMQDRQNAGLMGTETTGNCRRESFAHPPMPRMTNTFLDNGTDDPQDMLANVKDGIYAVGFGGGQVDIVNGKFVFNCTEAYRVKNGEVLYPVKGATLIGDGATALTKIKMVGNDLALDPGIGNCGKAGQWVPVSVGQPSVLMKGITIGGTAQD